MESTEAPIERTKLRQVYVVYTDVEEVKNQKDEIWWIHFRGSRESIAFPVPAFIQGDKVKITFEKVTDANAIQPPVE